MSEIKLNYKEDSKEFKGLHTMLPIKVFEELTEFAKSRGTVTGSWDYGVAIRELLLHINKYVDLYSYCMSLEGQINEIKEQMESKDDTPVQEKKKDEGPKLLGKHHLKEDRENGKDTR